MTERSYLSELSFQTFLPHSVHTLCPICIQCAIVLWPSGGQCNSSGWVQLICWISDVGSAHRSRLLEKATDRAGSSASVCLSAQCSSRRRTDVSPSHTPPDNTCTRRGECTHYSVIFLIILCILFRWKWNVWETITSIFKSVLFNSIHLHNTDSKMHYFLSENGKISIIFCCCSCTLSGSSTNLLLSSL